MKIKELLNVINKEEKIEVLLAEDDTLVFEGRVKDVFDSVLGKYLEKYSFYDVEDLFSSDVIVIYLKEPISEDGLII